jgi:hypothetical protein
MASGQQQVEDSKEPSQRLDCIMECFALSDSGSLFYEVPHKKTEAKVCVGVLGEVP